MDTWVQICVDVGLHFVFDHPFLPMWPQQAPTYLRGAAWWHGEYKVLASRAGKGRPWVFWQLPPPSQWEMCRGLPWNSLQPLASGGEV